MVYKVCISCNKAIAEKDRVDYDVFASMFKHDSSGWIVDMIDKPVIVYFHLNCFKKYKRDEKKKELYFSQEVGSKRIVIKSRNS